VIPATGHSWDNGVITKAPTETEDGEITYTCSVCGETYTESFKGGQVTCIGKSLSLNGDIGVNFYVALSRDILEDENARMVFTIGQQTHELALADAIEATVEGVACYKFSCSVAAKGMSDEITAQMHGTNGTIGEAIIYSVAAYYDDICEKFDRTEKAELFAMIEAMLNYGAAAQQYFGYNTGNLANAKVENKVLPETLDASAFAHVISGSEKKLALAGASLLLETETTLRIFFRITNDADITSYTFTVDGEEVTPVQREGLYYVELKNISAKNLDETHTITAGNLTVTYSALSYVHNVLNKADTLNPLLVEVSKALYLYNQAANAYFATKS